MSTSLRLITAFASTAIFAILSWVTISPGVPTVLRPCNLVVVIPLFLSDELPGGPSIVAASLVVPAAFCVWCWPIILKGSPTVPARSHVLFGFVLLLSLLGFVCGTRFAIGYHGLDYVVGTGIISALWWVTLGTLAYLAKRCPSYWRNLVFHLALFAWLAWYALPYLGELP